MVATVWTVVIAITVVGLSSTVTASAVHHCNHNADERQQLMTYHGVDIVHPQRYARGQAVGQVKPIRFVMSTLDVDDPTKSCSKVGASAPDFSGKFVNCTLDAQVLTAAKKALLTQTILPGAFKMHSDRLSITPVIGNLTLGNLASSCSSFTVPSDHKLYGVPDADFVLYVGAGLTPDGVMAWAAPCAIDDNKRPTVGVANFNPTYLDQANLDVTLRVAIHEITHALGFGTSLLLSPSQFPQLLSSASVRDKPLNTVVNASAVVSAAKQLFGCPNTTFVELEDEGGAGTAYSHWERRNHFQELMAGVVSNANYYSSLTLGLFNDSGIYVANFSLAEDLNISFGRNASCDFLTTKCLKNGVSNFPKFFCDAMATTSDPSMFGCTFDFKGFGSCTASQYSSSVPTYFQYFSNPSIGGTTMLTDMCPMYESFQNAKCDSSPGELNKLYVGSDGRCVLVTSGTQMPTCVRMRCPNSTRLQISTTLSPKWIDCPKDGSSGSLVVDGSTIVCPRAADVCRDASLYWLEPAPTPVPMTPVPSTAIPATPTPTKATTTTTSAPPSSAITTPVPPVATTTAAPVDYSQNLTARFTLLDASKASNVLQALATFLNISSSAFKYRLTSGGLVLEVDFPSSMLRDTVVALANGKNNSLAASLSSLLAPNSPVLIPIPTTPSPVTGGTTMAPSSGVTAALGTSTIIILAAVGGLLVLTTTVICCYRCHVKAEVTKKSKEYDLAFQRGRVAPAIPMTDMRSSPRGPQTQSPLARGPSPRGYPQQPQPYPQGFSQPPPQPYARSPQNYQPPRRPRYDDFDDIL